MRVPGIVLPRAQERLEVTDLSRLDYYYGLAKRQLLRYQSATSHLFPDSSSNKSEAHLRDSIYCSAAVWTLYQVLLLSLYFQRNSLNFFYWSMHTIGSEVIFHSIIGQW